MTNEITINGVALMADPMDADFNEKIHGSLQEAHDGFAAVQGDALSEADKIRKICRSIKKCFDATFGSGVGTQVCGERDNLETCTNAFLALTSAVKKQSDSYNKRAAEQARKLTAATKEA